MAWYDYDGFGLDRRRSVELHYLDEWTVVAETQKARLIRDNEGNQEWLPKSHTTIGKPPIKGLPEKVLWVSDWLVNKKALAWKHDLVDIV